MAKADTTPQKYPDPTGAFGAKDDTDILGKLFDVAYGLRDARARILSEQSDNRTALRSMKAVMTAEQRAEVDALYHPTERGNRAKASA